MVACFALIKGSPCDTLLGIPKMPHADWIEVSSIRKQNQAFKR